MSTPSRWPDRKYVALMAPAVVRTSVFPVPSPLVTAPDRETPAAVALNRRDKNPTGMTTGGPAEDATAAASAAYRRSDGSNVPAADCSARRSVAWRDAGEAL